MMNPNSAYAFAVCVIAGIVGLASGIAVVFGMLLYVARQFGLDGTADQFADLPCKRDRERMTDDARRSASVIRPLVVTV